MRVSDLNKEKSIGAFLRVAQLVSEHPEVERFQTVVERWKEAPRGVTNASYILVMDETPLRGCNEIAINTTNSSRIMEFLRRNFGPDGDVLDNLLGCAITFAVVECANYIDERTGLPQKSLQIVEIEPFDEEVNVTVRFGADAEPPAWVNAVTVAKEKSLAELKRERLAARMNGEPKTTAKQAKKAKK